MINDKYIRAEEVCTRLNQEIGQNVFTFGKLMKLAKNGVIKAHDKRTPGTKKPRYFFIYDEVKKSIDSFKKD